MNPVLTTINHYWNKLINLGIPPELNSRYQISIWRIFNFILYIASGILAVVIADEIISGDVEGLISASLFAVFTFHLLYLSSQGHYDTGSLLFNTGFSIGLLVISVTYVEVPNIELCFLILAFTAIMLTKIDWLKIFLFFFNTLCYLGIHFAERNFDLGERLLLNNSSNISIFAVCLIGLGMMTLFITRDLQKNDEEISKLVADLKEQNRLLESSNEELQRFTYLASHDLKAPIRSIISFIGLAENKLQDLQREDINTYFKYAKDSALQMNNLINDSLEYSKVNHDKVANSEVDLNLLVDKIKQGLSVEYPKGEIIYDKLPIIKSNESLLYKLLQNIIENGLKYNDKEEKLIKLLVTQEQDQISISISDNGIGIDQQFYEEIFTIYRRLHNNQEYKGTGLGLAICRKIVEQLKGQITVDSQLGSGTTFHIHLPV